jgi:hypothetical protein
MNELLHRLFLAASEGIEFAGIREEVKSAGELVLHDALISLFAWLRECGDIGQHRPKTMRQLRLDICLELYLNSDIQLQRIFRLHNGIFDFSPEISDIERCQIERFVSDNYRPEKCLLDG